MAFVYRSERETTDAKNNPNLGPGAYIGVGKGTFYLLFPLSFYTNFYRLIMKAF